MADFLYIENGVVKVTDMCMEIEEFKQFKRYDRSEKNIFFQKAMAYIFYVYQIYDSSKPEDGKVFKSYMFNQPLPQRKIQTVKQHTGPYKTVSDFEDNKYVKACIEAYLKYSMTQNMKMFDRLKEDIERFIDMVNETPYTIKQKVTVEKQVFDDGPMELIDVVIEIPNINSRIDLVKRASDLNDLFNKKLTDAMKDLSKKKSNNNISLFEDKEYIKTIPLNEIPMATE